MKEWLVTLTINPGKILLLLLVLILGLALVSFSLQYYKYVLHGRSLQLVRLFDVDEEVSIPTWYSSSALFLCSILLGVIASLKRREHNHFSLNWAFLSLIFLSLSADEAASFHEISIIHLRRALNLGGFLYFAWVVPGFLVLCIFGATYLRFFLHLPPTFQRLFLTAGILFTGGALGIELIGGHYFELHGRRMAYQAIVTLEELLEMLGVAVFLYALLLYLSTHYGPIALSFSRVARSVSPSHRVGH